MQVPPGAEAIVTGFIKHIYRRTAGSIRARVFDALNLTAEALEASDRPIVIDPGKLARSVSRHLNERSLQTDENLVALEFRGIIDRNAGQSEEDWMTGVDRAADLFLENLKAVFLSDSQYAARELALLIDELRSESRSTTCAIADKLTEIRKAVIDDRFHHARNSVAREWRELSDLLAGSLERGTALSDRELKSVLRDSVECNFPVLYWIQDNKELCCDLLEELLTERSFRTPMAAHRALVLRVHIGEDERILLKLHGPFHYALGDQYWLPGELADFIFDGLRLIRRGRAGNNLRHCVREILRTEAPLEELSELIADITYGESPEEVVDLLATLLEQGGAVVRRAAAENVCAAFHPSAADLAIRLLDKDSRSIQYRALRMLANLGNSLFSEVVPLHWFWPLFILGVPRGHAILGYPDSELGQIYFFPEETLEHGGRSVFFLELLRSVASAILRLETYSPPPEISNLHLDQFGCPVVLLGLVGDSRDLCHLLRNPPHQKPLGYSTAALGRDREDRNLAKGYVQAIHILDEKLHGENALRPGLHNSPFNRRRWWQTPDVRLPLDAQPTYGCPIWGGGGMEGIGRRKAEGATDVQASFCRSSKRRAVAS